MITKEKFKEYFASRIAGVALEVESQRHKVAPHYKRFYKKLLLLAAITLTLEIIIHIVSDNEQVFIFTPMVAGTIFLIGTVVIAIRQIPRSNKLLKVFDQRIGPELAGFFFPEWRFDSMSRDMADEIGSIPQYRNIRKPRLTGRCFYHKDGMTICDMDIFYRKSSVRGQPGVIESGTRDNHSEGLFFIQTLPEYQNEAWQIMPDRFEKLLGGSAARVLEMSDDFFRTVVNITGSDNMRRRGVPGYDTDIVRFDDDAYDKCFQTRKQPGSEVRYLDDARRSKLVQLREDLGYNFTLSMYKGKLYFYMPCRAFLCMSKYDMSYDISKFEYYERYLEDAELAYKVIESFSNNN